MSAADTKAPARLIVVGVLRNARGDAKTFPDGRRADVYMVFLLFECRIEPGEIRKNEESDAVAFVPAPELRSYRLNRATVVTFTRLGLIGFDA